MTILPAAPFAPDSEDLSETTNLVLNVMPLTPSSYGPLNSYVSFSLNSIDSRPLGVAFSEDSDLDHHIFAGTQAKLWTIIPDQSRNWADVTPTAGVNASQQNWRFANYKDLMIATDFADPIQYQNMPAGGLFAPLSGLTPVDPVTGAPITLPSGTTNVVPNARYLAVAKDFLITAYTNDPTGGFGPQRIWWSGAGVPSLFPTPGSDTAQQYQSDYNDCFGPQGSIVGLAPNLQGADCGVFFERGVWRMNYAGPPDVFTFYPALTQKGCIAPNSLVPLGTLVYFLGEDGFYSFDGYSVAPIGANMVDKFFFANVDTTAYDRVIGAASISNKAIIWLWRSLIAPDMNPDSLLFYRYDIQRWSFAHINLTWIARLPAPSASGTLSTVAGQLQLGAIGPNLDLGYFGGEPYEAQIGTKTVQITPDARTFVYRSRPLVQLASQGGYLLTESGNVILTEDGRGIQADAPIASANVTIALSARNDYYDPELFGPEVAPDISGDCPQRIEGRYHRARVTIQPGLWTRFTGVDLVGIKSGIR